MRCRGGSGKVFVIDFRSAEITKYDVLVEMLTDTIGQAMYVDPFTRVAKIYISPTTLRWLRFEIYEKTRDKQKAQSYTPAKFMDIEVEVKEDGTALPCPFCGV